MSTTSRKFGDRFLTVIPCGGPPRAPRSARATRFSLNRRLIQIGPEFKRD